MTIIARNSPCPCGSRRKYKHCCEGKQIGTGSNVGVTPGFVRIPPAITTVFLDTCFWSSLFESDANTFTLASRLQKELFHFPYRSIIPDSTGKARKTSSQKSDHQILKDAGFTLDVTTNPPIRDRQNALNRMFNLKKIVIDPSCTNLIKELETLASRDKEGEVAHISVALGYVIHKLFPVVQRKKPTMIQR